MTIDWRQGCAQELLLREQILSSLSFWCEFNGYKPARHHRLIIDKLEAVARGDILRLALFMPPGSAKSTYTSVLFPPWLLAQDPKALILAASHTTELAERWGRRVRNIIADNDLLLEIKLSDDNQAANRWSLQSGGEYYAAGANVGIAGFRALYGLIDDPIRSRQDADSLLVRDRLWDWYLNDFRPRLVPGARQVLIQCLTGDTRVLMADGTEKELRNIRRGDRVASYDRNTREIVAETILNWTNQGPDSIFTIRTKSGTTVKANARHPFLVEIDGVQEWQRTDTLKKGARLLKVTGASGAERSVREKDASDRPSAAASACRTTTRIVGSGVFARLRSTTNQAVRRISNIVTASLRMITMSYLIDRMEFVPSVPAHRQQQATDHGRESCSSIIATLQEQSGDYFVTNAISPLAVAPSTRQSIISGMSLHTLNITSDEVVEVVPAGVEDVFDIQISRTENFISNGYCSHNTRWHEDDLAGRVLNHEPWETIELPALAKANDPLGRDLDEPLWTDDDYGYGQQLLGLRETTPPRVWSALYQQTPTPDEGDFFREEWLKPRDIIPHPSSLRVYGASDYAVTKDGGDYTVHAVVGVDHLNNMYLLDVWRRQATSDVWVDAFCDLVLKYHPLEWAEEPGQIKSGVGPFLEKRMRQRRAYVNRRPFSSRGDKAVRARSMQGRMALDGLYYPKHANWVSDFLAEILNFPASKHDDQVDALGLVGQLLDIMVVAKLKKNAIPQLPDDGYREKKPKLVDAMTL